MVRTSTSASSARRLSASVALVLIASVVLGVGIQGAKGQETTASVEITSASCLLCHSDHAGVVEFGHRAATEELGGCMVCHGNGTEHVLSRGAPGTIRNPDKLEPDRSNRSCLMCHSDRAPPDHFQPEPGKAKCADCHTVHPVAVVVAAPDETPGRPPFVMDVAEGTTLPTSPEEDGLEVIGARLSGEVRIGGRIIAVNGNERVYEQDRGYDDGFRLFEGRVEAWEAGNRENRILAEVTGIDDPVEHYRLDGYFNGDLSLDVDLMRENLVYRASADPWDYAARRERLTAELSYHPEKALRITGGYHVYARDGRRRGARFLGGAIREAVEPFEEAAHYGYLRLEANVEDASLSLTGGYRFDYYDFNEVSRPGDPAMDPALDLSSKTDLDGPVFIALGRVRPIEQVELDGRFIWTVFDTDTRIDSTTLTPAGGQALEETIRSDIEGLEDHLRYEAGVTWTPSTELLFAARFEGLSTLEESKGRVLSGSAFPAGSLPIVTEARPESARETTRYRFQGEVGYRPCDWGAVRAGYEWANERFRWIDPDGRGRHEADLEGPFFMLDLDPADDLSLQALYRFVRVDEPFAEIGTEDEDQARFRARYRASEAVSVSAFVAHRLTSNHAHDTDILAWSTGTTIVYAPTEDFTLDTTFEFQEFDTETDVVRVIEGIPVMGRSQFEGSTLGGTIFATWDLLPEFRLNSGVSWYHTTGDVETDLLDLLLGTEIRFTEGFSVGADLRYTDYDEDDATPDDYDAFTVALWARIGF